MSIRLLLNENFPAPSTRFLREAGCSVLSIPESHAGTVDREVLAFAAAEQRWLITFDRDNGKLLFVRCYPARPAVILEPGKMVSSHLH